MLTGLFKPGNTSASQSEAILQNPCWLTGIFFAIQATVHFGTPRVKVKDEHVCVRLVIIVKYQGESDEVFYIGNTSPRD